MEDQKKLSRAGLLGSLNQGAASNVFGPGGLGAGVGSGIGHGGGGLGAVGHGAGVAGPVVSGRMGLKGGDLRSPGEDYGPASINGWVEASADHLSTFAADVDTASYTVARRKLLGGELPPPDSVRVEEWLNYFRYRYPEPTEGPLAVTLDAAPSPFTAGKTLLRVGVQARRLAVSERKQAHLTFLVDVSGSMQGPDRLPLAKRALRLLVDNLRDGDTVALVTYAGRVSLVLPPTGIEHRVAIHEAIEGLSAGGSTAMSSGIELAYAQAVKGLDARSFSRVLVLSDGDANVGATSHDDILKLIQGHVKEGVTLTTVGFGMGNYKDGLMEQLADKGNGNHFYCDSLFEAHRIFVEQLGSTLEVVAQDVKFQVDFDPAQVKRYRLVGYENRDLADRDFRNDKVDAGEVGSGHSVTALYELELAAGAGEGLATVRVRAKKPRGTEASEWAFPVHAAALHSSAEAAGKDFQFAAAVMGAAELFRQSPHAKGTRYDDVLALARGAADTADRRQFVELLEKARAVAMTLASR
ncbi:MAG: VWA domain-containing protein [Myxococcaceae bacterium]|nr:VWA domain-containing protein [Myxococcaceae bacterium]